ncbi:MAG: celE1 [Fibrobacteres bacterium]|nr:celE1 [Fibrobacterota bacterium]
MRRESRLRLFAGALALCSLWLPESVRAATRVFILAGQSNMVGLGKVSGIPAGYLNGAGKVAYYVTAPAGISPYEFTNPIKAGNAAESSSCNSGTQYISKGNFGPEVGMAKVLAAAYPADKIVLVKAAWGGTSLATGWVGGSAPTYIWFRNQTRLMLDDLKMKFPGYQLQAIVWLQGETDGSDPNFAKAYKANFQTLIAKMRTDFGANLPFLYGTIQNSGTTAGGRVWPYGNAVVHVQRTLRGIANLGCTSKSSSGKATVYTEEYGAQCSSTPCAEPCYGYNRFHYNADGALFVGESLGNLVKDYFAKGTNAIVKCNDYTLQDVVGGN